MSVRKPTAFFSFSFQCYLFAYFSIWRNSKSFLAFALICLSNMYLYEMRNIWQILFHVTVGAFMTLQIKLRQPLGKAPDYNVWWRRNAPAHILEIQWRLQSPAIFQMKNKITPLHPSTGSTTKVIQQQQLHHESRRVTVLSFAKALTLPHPDSFTGLTGMILGAVFP